VCVCLPVAREYTLAFVSTGLVGAERKAWAEPAGWKGGAPTLRIGVIPRILLRIRPTVIFYALHAQDFERKIP
jgi:hypothetical protein